MPARQTPAIVLTVKDFGEADRLVTFLTPERGVLTGMAKHAKKSRKRFANVLEPLNRVEFFLSQCHREFIIRLGKVIHSDEDVTCIRKFFDRHL